MDKINNKSLEVSLGDWTIKNPIIPASGVYGYGLEFLDYYDINILGSISIKGTTLEPRFGNEQPRIAEVREGLINSIGLQNNGIDHVIKEELPTLKRIFNDKVIANISGFSLDEYRQVAEKLDNVDNVGIIEVNISCPNVHNGGMSFGTNCNTAAEVTREIKKAVKNKPVYLKLSPNVTNISEIARAVVDAGADGISLINTMMGMEIDVIKRKCVLANRRGGFSGPAIFPIALEKVYTVASVVDVPIIGIGGIATADDVLKMIMAGATAVQVGASNLVNPYACKDIIEELPRRMCELEIESLDEIRGVALL